MCVSFLCLCVFCVFLFFSFFSISDLKLALHNTHSPLFARQAAVKECKWATRKLHEMATELAGLGDLSGAEALSERMSGCERDKMETETLLLELTEEWEQCERKMTDVQGWCESSRGAPPPAPGPARLL